MRAACLIPPHSRASSNSLMPLAGPLAGALAGVHGAVLLVTVPAWLLLGAMSSK
jgi:hypothetical protein